MHMEHNWLNFSKAMEKECEPNMDPSLTLRMTGWCYTDKLKFGGLHAFEIENK